MQLAKYRHPPTEVVLNLIHEFLRWIELARDGLFADSVIHDHASFLVKIDRFELTLNRPYGRSSYRKQLADVLRGFTCHINGSAGRSKAKRSSAVPAYQIR